MRLFEGYPALEDDVLIIRKMSFSDAKALKEMTENRNIYHYLPTFLYECRYEDKREVLEKMDVECMKTHDSVLMGIYPKEKEDELLGIAEIYSYKEERNTASIGYRLKDEYWGKGIATRVARLLRDYLIDEIGLRTITAHVMRENKASGRVLIKNGFYNKYPDTMEDWGFEEPVLVDKYVIQNK